MSKKRNKSKVFSTRRWDDPFSDKKTEPTLFFDYYLQAFALFHEKLKREGYVPEKPHAIRKRFWGLLPYRTYEPLEAREILLSYINTVENTIAEIVSKNSLAYWLHLYRRLYPSSIGTDKQNTTVGLVRSTLEAAIQKYARLEPCNRVGVTGKISLDQVLGGVLMAPEFDLERKSLRSGNQLVLTNFTHIELREFYELERLVYELWRGTAMLRITAKGAPIVVENSDNAVFDLRSVELDKLVEIFDERNKKWQPSIFSASGVVGEKVSFDLKGGMVLLPTYNLTSISFEELKPFFAFFHFNLLSFDRMDAPNFVWIPFPLRQYRNAHLPFAQAFKENHGVELDKVLLVIAALDVRIFYMWKEAKYSLLRFFQRAYEGPYRFDDIVKEITFFIPEAIKLLNLSYRVDEPLDLSKAVQFWQLDESKRSIMDLAYSGPHSIFLPYNQNRVFIDYAWILRRLRDLFVGVNIPDQNFKGEALEHLVRFKSSALPVNQCQAKDGTARQIDAAYVINKRLVIVECRAVGRSIGFDRGEPNAIRYRTGIVDKALKDTDEKANWLLHHPVGTNYDITHCKDILPIAVTPFAEFIHSLNPYYWLTENLPRVLTPEEFKTALEDGTLTRVTANTISLDIGQTISDY